MTVFADSSALVKLYVAEEGSDVVTAMDDLVVSAIARVEVPAALWRKQRLAGSDPGAARVLVEAFEADLLGSDLPPRFAVVALAPSVLDDAARLAAVHGLRAYDAVQLAAARAAGDVADCRTVAVFDRELRAAAAAEGLAVVP